jgi:hypothetical protein
VANPRESNALTLNGDALCYDAGPPREWTHFQLFEPGAGSSPWGVTPEAAFSKHADGAHLTGFVTVRRCCLGSYFALTR